MVLVVEGVTSMVIIQGGTLVCPDGLRHGDVALDGDKVVRIAGAIEPAAGDEVYDAHGCWVFPGFIDAHTHMQCWTGIDWTADSFETGTRAAACGGTTTIVDYATADRGVTMPDALDEWHKRADGTCTANYAFHMALAEWNERNRADLSVMRERGVCSFKSYFAYDHLRLDDAETLELLEALKPLGGTLCVHCENGTLVDALQQRVYDAGIHGPEGHPLSRQKNIFVETCPQYLLLDDTCFLKDGQDGLEGLEFVMSPPPRKPADRAALREALVNGEIDTIATDHCSFNIHGQKDRGIDDFRKVPNGGAGVEHRPALIATTFADQLGPEDLCRLMSENPAKVFGMWPAKGRLAEGADADICVWDPSVSWTISVATQHQNVDHTPYEGFECRGRSRFTFVNGVLAAREGEPTGELPGRYVSR